MRKRLTCLFMLLVLLASSQNKSSGLDYWIRNSTFIVVGKVRLHDVSTRDYHSNTGNAHIYIEPTVGFLYPEDETAQAPEIYVHFLSGPHSFMPEKGKSYVFFLIKHQGVTPAFWTLVQDSLGALAYTPATEREIYRLLYSQKGDSSCCNYLRLDMKKLNAEATRKTLLHQMLHAPEYVWKNAERNFLCVLQNDSFNARAHLSVMWLLGQRRSSLAIPILINHIGEETFPEENKALDEEEAQPYESLRMIGLPAYSLLEKHLNSCKDYQDYKMTMLTLNAITPFRNKHATRRFVKNHFKSAPESIKPFYVFMRYDLSEWEAAVIKYNHRNSRQ